jgi:DNA-binding LytR/AlgR family response regulator
MSNVALAASPQGDSAPLFRTHRSAIVNLRYVVEVTGSRD